MNESTGASLAKTSISTQNSALLLGAGSLPGAASGFALGQAAGGADLAFPQGFVCGSATASYQVEGAVNEGGRGASMWDTFSHTAGKTANGDTGDVADDFYHRYGKDIQMMQQLGIKGFRFSVSWSRIFPSGTGKPNQAGIDFYKRLVDALLAAGIQPCSTGISRRPCRTRVAGRIAIRQRPSPTMRASRPVHFQTASSTS